MTDPVPPKSDALRAMYWRSEVLQVMYWLRGEGLNDHVDAELLERFLGVDALVTAPYLDRLVDEGLLEKTTSGYALSPLGAEQGAEEFEASFADLTHPAHGECGADCWCHSSPEEADACAADRAAHQH